VPLAVAVDAAVAKRAFDAAPDEVEVEMLASYEAKFFTGVPTPFVAATACSFVDCVVVPPPPDPVGRLPPLPPPLHAARATVARHMIVR
jgi:hypothetical protein